MSVRINYAFIDDVLNRVAGTGNYDHDDSDLYFTPDDGRLEALVSRLVDKYAVPELNEWDEFQSSQLKTALQYLLTFDRDAADSLFQSAVYGFGFPQPRWRFYECLWNGLFPGEDFQMTRPTERFEVVKDSDEVGDHRKMRVRQAREQEM